MILPIPVAASPAESLGEVVSDDSLSQEEGVLNLLSGSVSEENGDLPLSEENKGNSFEKIMELSLSAALSLNTAIIPQPVPQPEMPDLSLEAELGLEEGASLLAETDEKPVTTLPLVSDEDVQTLNTPDFFEISAFSNMKMDLGNQKVSSEKDVLPSASSSTLADSEEIDLEATPSLSKTVSNVEEGVEEEIAPSPSVNVAKSEKQVAPEMVSKDLVTEKTKSSLPTDKVVLKKSKVEATEDENISYATENLSPTETENPSLQTSVAVEFQAKKIETPKDKNVESGSKEAPKISLNESLTAAVSFKVQENVEKPETSKIKITKAEREISVSFNANDFQSSLVTDKSALDSLKEAPGLSKAAFVINAKAGTMSPEDKAAVFKQVGDALHVQVRESKTQTELRLDPPSWGKIEISMTRDQNEVHVSFKAEHVFVKETIEKSLVELRQNFSSEGLRLGRVDVGLGDQSSQFQQQQDQERALREQQEVIAAKVNKASPSGIRHRDPLSKLVDHTI